MKKKIVLILIISLILSTALIIPNNKKVEAKASASTIAEFRKILADLEKQKKQAQNDKKETQNSITSTKNSVTKKQEQISINQGKITASLEESKQLELEIEKGKEELENIVKTYQVSSSDNVYLEYIFNSKTYEELVYRYAIIEQIMDYQNDRITKWKEKIDYNNQLKIDLEQKEKELNAQIDSLSQDLKKLGTKLNNITDMALDLDAEIKSVKEQIDYYKSIGCGENENLDECISVRGDKILRRPLVKGTVVSNFGNRLHPVYKVWKLHSGTDISIKEGTNVYATANGTVGKIVKKSKCGGNMVYIWHFVDGKKWTSTYMHLLTINVKLGQKVTSNDVIGLSGGNTTGKRKGGYDECTTGAHLHFSLAKGWYTKDKDVMNHNQWVAHLVNPRDVVNLPKTWTKRDA